MPLGVDADVYFTVEMSHVSQLGQRPAAVDAYLVTLQHEVLAAIASGRHVVQPSKCSAVNRLDVPMLDSSPYLIFQPDHEIPF